MSARSKREPSVGTKPRTIDALLARAEALCGRTLASIAQEHGIEVPPHLKRHKGWIGQLLEFVLGADCNHLPQPDFYHLQIELKTVPVNSDFKPMESTYVCHVPLQRLATQSWHHSPVYCKLKNVLWIPVIGGREHAPGDRCIGPALLWQPTQQQWEILEQDWQCFSERINAGELDQITGSLGQALQIRPKGANAKSLVQTLDADGLPTQTLPRGYYLRSRFLHSILQPACQPAREEVT